MKEIYKKKVYKLNHRVSFEGFNLQGSGQHSKYVLQPEDDDYKKEFERLIKEYKHVIDSTLRSKRIFKEDFRFMEIKTNVILHAYRCLRAWNPEIVPFAIWLRNLTKWQILSYYKNRKGLKCIGELTDNICNAIDSPSRFSDRHYNSLYQAVIDFKGGQTILLLRLKNYSINDISIITGHSIEETKSILRKFRKFVLEKKMFYFPELEVQGGWGIKLSEKDIKAILTSASFCSIADLAKKYDVHTSTIYNIFKGKHSFIEKPESSPVQKKFSRRLTDKEVQQILSLYKKKKRKEIAVICNVSLTTVDRLLTQYFPRRKNLSNAA